MFPENEDKTVQEHILERGWVWRAWWSPGQKANQPEERPEGEPTFAMAMGIRDSQIKRLLKRTKIKLEQHKIIL